MQRLGRISEMISKPQQKDAKANYHNMITMISEEE